MSESKPSISPHEETLDLAKQKLAKLRAKQLVDTVVASVPQTPDTPNDTPPTVVTHPFQKRRDSAYKKQLRTAQRELYATEKAAGAPIQDSNLASSKASLGSPDVPSTPVIPDASEPIVSSTPETSTAATPDPETKPTDWILERVLNEIPDGSKFVLRSPTGKTHSEYHREGNAILSSKDGVVTENVLARLNKGWALEVKAAEASTAAKTENRDLLKGRDPKDYNTVFPGDVWTLRTPDGKVLDKLTIKLIFSIGGPERDIVNAKSEWEKSVFQLPINQDLPFDNQEEVKEWELGDFQKKLQAEGYVLEMAGEKLEKAVGPGRLIDHKREQNPYDTIKENDEWELRNDQGRMVKRISVESVYEKTTGFGQKKKKVGQYVDINTEDAQAKFKRRSKVPLETFRQELQDEGYLLITRGEEFDMAGLVEEEKTKKPEDTLLLPGLGARAKYGTSYGYVLVEYDVSRKLYYVTQADTNNLIGAYSVGNIRRLAELQAWEKIEEEPAEPKLQSEESPKKAELTPKESLINLPEGGNELYYRANNGSEFKVRKNPAQEGVYILVALSTLQEREISEAELQDLARKNAWEQFEKGPEPLVGPLPLEKAIQDAREAVGQARADFVRIEAEYRGKENWLKKIFPALKNRDEINPELRRCLEIYERALTTLQSLEIEKIKRSGIKDTELKQSIAHMIREYDFEEAERIDDDKRTLRLKEQKPLLEKVKTLWESTLHNKFDGENPGGKKWRDWAMVMIGGTAIAGEALYRGTRAVGVEYNKIASTKGGKITLMAAGGAAFGTALIFSGGAAATMAGVMLAAKKAAAGAGGAVATEGLADYGAKVLRSRTTNKKTEGFLEKSKDDEIEMMLEHGLKAVNPDSERDLLLERLEKFLKKDVNQEAYGKSIKRERNRLYRKTGAVMAGVLFGNSSFVGNIFSEAQAAVPEGGGNQMAKVVEVIEKSTETMPSAGESVIDTTSLLQERTVSAGDTITKYAVTSGKSLGLEGEEGKRFAALLREKLNEKLASVDPDTAKAAGFVPNKDGVLSADFIRTGEKLELGKILRAEEMKALVEQAKETVTAPVTPPVEIPAPTSQTVLDATAKVLQEAGIAPASTPAVTEVVTPTTPDAIAEFGASKQKVTEYIQTLPQAEQVEVFRTMRGTMRDLFNTPEISIYGNYDMNYDLKEHPELAKASMSRVLEDHKTLSSRAFYMYDRSLNPLHWTQMQELAKFTEGATKVLGKEVATPLKRESIEEYILRMALIAKESNKSFPGLHMVK